MKPLSCPSQFILWQQRAVKNNFQEKEPSHKVFYNHTQAKADLDDVLDVMEKLDGRQALPNFYCEADDLVYLPPAVPARSVSVEMHVEPLR